VLKAYLSQAGEPILQRDSHRTYTEEITPHKTGKCSAIHLDAWSPTRSCAEPHVSRQLDGPREVRIYVESLLQSYSLRFTNWGAA
jgi:hypothetical protein